MAKPGFREEPGFFYWTSRCANADVRRILLKIRANTVHFGEKLEGRIAFAFGQ